jgi:hypothetical protein
MARFRLLPVVLCAVAGIGSSPAAEVDWERFAIHGAERAPNAEGPNRITVGIRPTIPSRCTIAGVRAGRDELLEVAVAMIRHRLTVEDGSHGTR